MRKYSDRYFKIPVKICKLDDVEQFLKDKELGAVEEDEDVDFAIGYVRLDPFGIVDWFDSFSPSRSISDVRKNGFDCTRIISKSGEVYDCMWDRTRFEDRLNKFVEGLETELEEEIKRMGEEDNSL